MVEGNEYQYDGCKSVNDTTKESGFNQNIDARTPSYMNNWQYREEERRFYEEKWGWDGDRHECC